MRETVNHIRQLLAAGPLVLDGATGTELERRGVDTAAPLWSASALLAAPDVVLAIHREYVAAGAEILVANTFRTNPRTLQHAGRLADGAALNMMAVDLARRASGRSGALVAASVAPVEDCYSPERVPSVAALQQEHEQMAIWLQRAEPDLVWIETMNTASEARIAAQAAARAGMPFAVSFVVRENGHLLSGEPLLRGVAAVEALEPLAIGVNCVPARGIAAVLRDLRLMTSRPLAAYGHIGNAKPIPGWSYAHDASPEQYADCVQAWLELGVTIVGGCCGTTPAHIRAVRALVERSRGQRAGARPAGGVG